MSRSFRLCRLPRGFPCSPPGTVSSRTSDAAAIETARALADVRTWAPLLVVQMRRLGVDSLPIALFIAVFTGIVLSLLSSYIFTGAVPLYFVGALVGQDRHDGAGPGAHRAWRSPAGSAPASPRSSGTMKVTEQVDALETLAYDRNAYLVVPRVLAATLMFPVVTAFAMAVGVDVGLDHLGQPARPLDARVLQGAQAVLPLQGHLVRPGQERELRRRRRADGLPPRPRRPERRRRASASPPPAPWCSAARRSWCWTRSGRWCCCEAGGGGRRSTRPFDVHVSRPPRAEVRSSRPSRVLDGVTLEVPDGAEHRHHRPLGRRARASRSSSSSGCSSPTRGGCGWTATWCRSMDRERARRAARPDRLRLPVRRAVRLDDGGGEHRAGPGEAEVSPRTTSRRGSARASAVVEL